METSGVEYRSYRLRGKGSIPLASAIYGDVVQRQRHEV